MIDQRTLDQQIAKIEECLKIQDPKARRDAVRRILEDAWWAGEAYCSDCFCREEDCRDTDRTRQLRASGATI